MTNKKATDRGGPVADDSAADAVVCQHYTPSRLGAQPLATRRQRAYLVGLIRRIGRVKYLRVKRRLSIDGGPLQVSRSEASRLIEALLEELQR